MNEKELLNMLSSLRKIEPRKDWIIFAKTRILADYKPITADAKGVGHIIDTFAFIMRRPAFAMAGLGLVISLGVLFQWNQQKLAQDAVAQLALAQQRLEQLQTIAAANKGDFKGDLSAALKEFQETSAKLSRQVPGLVSKDRTRALQAGIAIVQLQKSAADLEKVFGVSVGEKTQEELQTAIKTLIENELSDLATRTLSVGQQALFEEAKSAFGTGDYETALEKIWEVSN